MKQKKQEKLNSEQIKQLQNKAEKEFGYKFTQKEIINLTIKFDKLEDRNPANIWRYDLTPETAILNRYIDNYNSYEKDFIRALDMMIFDFYQDEKPTNKQIRRILDNLTYESSRLVNI